MGVLRIENLEGMGTIMANHIRNFTFLPDKGMKQGECQGLCHEDDEGAVVKWCDSRSVVMASTCSGKSPVWEVKH